MKISLFTHYDDVCIGLRIIASLLEQHGHRVQLLFLKPFRRPRRGQSLEFPKFIETLRSTGSIHGSGYDIDPLVEKDFQLLFSSIREFEPEIIGLSSRSILDNINVKLMARIRDEFPGVVTVSGGYGPSFSPERYAACCDYVVVGEGELAMLELVQSLETGSNPECIANLAYMRNDRYHRNPMRPMLDSLESLPLMKVMGTNTATINKGKTIQEDTISRASYPMIYGRGCARNCSYCSAGQWPSLYAELFRTPKLYRTKTMDGLFAELDWVKQKGFKSVAFLDSFVVAPKDVLLDLFRRYSEEIGLPFYMALHPSQIVKNPEILDRACEAGLQGGSVGIQSGSVPFAREVYDRKQSNEEILEYRKLLKSHGLWVDYHFICGNPLETVEHIEESLKLIRSIPYDPNDSLSCMRLHVFPGTKLEKILRKAGRGKEETQSWLLQACLYQMRWLCDDQEFESVRHNRFFLDNPYHMIDMIKRKRWEYLASNHIPNLSWGFSQDVIPYYSFVLNDLDFHHRSDGIVIWGAGEKYRELAHLFRNTHRKMLVDKNLELQGKTIDGMTVQAPESLKDRPFTVFVLSGDKQAVWEELRATRPDIHIV